MKRFKTILMVGPPGCGKGTQGRALGSFPGIFHCACGDVLRSMDSKHPQAQLVLDYASRGLLVPDRVVMEAWQEHLREVVQRGRFDADGDWLLLDGVPRNREQAELLDPFIEVQHVLDFQAPTPEELKRRLFRRASCENRSDDRTWAVIEMRIQTFERERGALLGHYAGRSRVHAIDAAMQPPVVMQQILACIWPISGAPAAGHTEAA